jgi:hypothetical protein
MITQVGRHATNCLWVAYQSASGFSMAMATASAPARLPPSVAVADDYFSFGVASDGVIVFLRLFWTEPYPHRPE